MLEEGDNYSELKSVISIWVLKKPLFPEIEYPYIDFCLYNRKHEIILTDHIYIHLLQLSKYRHGRKELSNKEKWTYLLKEGKDMNLNQLPQEIDIPEIRQAAQVMRRFSERESDYLLYESRLDAHRERATLHSRMAKTERALEQERRAREKADKEIERLTSLLKNQGINC